MSGYPKPAQADGVSTEAGKTASMVTEVILTPWQYFILVPHGKVGQSLFQADAGSRHSRGCVVATQGRHPRCRGAAGKAGRRDVGGVEVDITNRGISRACYNLYSRSQTARQYAVVVLGEVGEQRLRKVQAVILSSSTGCSTKSLKKVLTRL